MTSIFKILSHTGAPINSVKKKLSPLSAKPPETLEGLRELVDPDARLSIDIDLVYGSTTGETSRRSDASLLSSFVSALLPFVGHYLVVALDV